MNKEMYPPTQIPRDPPIFLSPNLIHNKFFPLRNGEKSKKSSTQGILPIQGSAQKEVWILDDTFFIKPTSN